MEQLIGDDHRRKRRHLKLRKVFEARKLGTQTSVVCCAVASQDKIL